eukprot:CAMPEP_0198266468 /NCGR_PEP_ID=MMETSP1447-20131203/28531_1 /TAXON_ID=420782 /ORGANISM="Chaetoceros dichaeta, Strain CCMP1751" /LENGTH=156 /DNA_ID=CAMNT_0043956557 /DNA_START=103 /DNA_END=573 /DNA_ORIENTATION=+
MQPSTDYSEVTEHLEQGKNVDFLTLEGYEMLDLLDFEEMTEPICDGSSKDVKVTEMKSSKARRKSMEHYLLASTSSRKRRSFSPNGIRYAEPSDDMRNISNPKKVLQQDKPVSISSTTEGLPHDPINRLYEASLLRLAISLKRSTFSRMRVIQYST